VDRHIDEGRGNRPAIRVDGRRATYGKIHRSVNQIGDALLNLGVERGGPRWIEFVPALPKTATGKIQRYKLREAAQSDSPLP
jgi:acyl-coenzyme A synthetase/AMP-(fatty) acid ligase